MKTATLDYILRIASHTNILPVISDCRNGCIFCSHKNNPENVDIYRLPHLTFDDIAMISRYLNGGEKIVIGESASRIIEGEPFLREDMVDILKLLRSMFPTTPIEITTSGSYLTHNIISEIKKLCPIELNISLNSSSPRGRQLLHRDKNINGALHAVHDLNESGVEFNGSIVAMPDIVGYRDIEDTIAYLCMNNARTVRVFVPGFSRLSKYSVDFDEIRQRLHEIAEKLYMQYEVPILVEPPMIDSLDAEICGIIKGSAASRAGLLKGDRVEEVNGIRPITRVEAYRLLYKYKDPMVKVMRKSKSLNMVIEKDKNTSAGAVFYYDIDPEVIRDIEKAVQRHKSVNPLIITSKLGYGIIKLCMDSIASADYNVLPAENVFFGGTIMCAGLLTVDDIIQKVNEYKQINMPDLIIIPSIAFDIYGRDISGKHWSEIENIVEIKTVIIE